MTERYVVTLDDADRFVRFHSTRETKSCTHCCEVTSNTSLTPSPAHGWELNADRASWLLRCYECRGVREREWLASADRERVRSWLQAEFAKHGDLAFVIDWDDLKRSVL